MKRILLIFLFLPALVLAGVNDDGRRDGTLMYGPATDAQCTTIANHYAWTIQAHCDDLNLMRDINPDFKMFFYISIEDVPSGSEKTYMDSLATANGINPEVFYFHFWDSTIAVRGSDTTWCGGIENATSAEDTTDSRIHIYSQTRYMRNLYSDTTRQYSRFYPCYALSKTYIDGYGACDNVPNGVFWDNAACGVFNTYSAYYGGHIAEHPTHEALSNIGYSGTDWWWNSCLKPFNLALVDTFDLGDDWSLDNAVKYSVPNTAGSWDDDYAVSSTMHYIFNEKYVRWTQTSPSIMTWHARDSTATANGVCFIWAPSISLTVSPYAGTCVVSECLMRQLSMFYVMSTDSAYLLIMPSGGYSPDQAGWDTLVWCEAMDYDMGSPTANMSLDTSGTDGRGYSFSVYKRYFDNGVAYYRPRLGSTQDCDTTTEIVVFLDSSLYQLWPHGEITGPQDSVLIWNGDGAIVLFDAIPDTTISQILSCADTTTTTLILSVDFTLQYTVVDSIIFEVTVNDWVGQVWADTLAYSSDPQIDTAEGLSASTEYKCRTRAWDTSAGVTDTSNVLTITTEAAVAKKHHCGKWRN